MSIYKSIRKSLRGYGLGNIQPIKAINSYLMKSLRKDCVQVQGYTMFLDKVDMQALSVDEFEPAEVEFAKQNIKEGDVVIDLGAFIGYYTLLFSKLVGNTGKVYAFEPNPENFALLKKNMEYNDCKNVVLINKAVSNTNGKCRFYLSELNAGSGSLDVKYDIMFSKHYNLTPPETTKEIEIETINLDDFFKPIQNKSKISFIKMDIEGAEYSALLGMKYLIRRSDGIKMIIEYQPWTLAEAKVEPNKLLELIKELGFGFRNVQDKDLKEYSVEAKDWTNLLCEAKK